ncbi:MAG: outer membrane beta-barrel protein [Spirochaetes bacterium]|nr:outer membrane beta-barrel protein [Spirochaetota bacterium]MBN2772494.1 outer membrane beta-barrel protein [Spirochaetota bacterium]
MKKIIYFIAMMSVFSGFSVNALAGNVTELSMGATQADAVGDDWGLNVSAAWWNELNYMFALGFNPQFVWFQWDKYVTDNNGDKIYQEKEVGGVVDEYPVVEQANAYLIPLHIVAKVQFPLSDTVTPYLKGGGGYTFMPLTYSDADSEMFGGATWTAAVGCQFRVPDIPNFRFFAEFGYRGSKLTNDDNVQIDMSGVVIHAGVQYGLTRDKPRPATTDSGIVW